MGSSRPSYSGFYGKGQRRPSAKVTNKTFRIFDLTKDIAFSACYPPADPLKLFSVFRLFPILCRLRQYKKAGR
jgi:hypothetical protein